MQRAIAGLILMSLLSWLDFAPTWAAQTQGELDALNEGLKLHEAGKPKEAIREYDRAIKANPKLAEAYFNRGNAHYDLGQNMQALRDYNEVLRSIRKTLKRCTTGAILTGASKKMI